MPGPARRVSDLRPVAGVIAVQHDSPRLSFSLTSEHQTRSVGHAAIHGPARLPCQLQPRAPSHSLELPCWCRCEEQPLGLPACLPGCAHVTELIILGPHLPHTGAVKRWALGAG